MYNKVSTSCLYFSHGFGGYSLPNVQGLAVIIFKKCISFAFGKNACSKTHYTNHTATMRINRFPWFKIIVIGNKLFSTACLQVIL